MEVAEKPQRMEAMKSVKPTNGHINDNGSNFKLSGTHKQWRQQPAIRVNPRL
jgi:hypothetical protein